MPAERLKLANDDELLPATTYRPGPGTGPAAGRTSTQRWLTVLSRIAVLVI